MDSETNVAHQPRRESRPAGQPVNDAQILDDAVAYIRRCAHETPEKFALCCLGIGFILGWKLKPW